MKLNLKIIVVVSLCLFMGVTTVSAHIMNVVSVPTGAQVYYKLHTDPTYTNPGVTPFQLNFGGAARNYDVYVTLGGYITPAVQTQSVSGTVTFTFTLVPITSAIAIDKVTNGLDGQNILIGTPITWTYYVTNPGNVPMSTISVTDNIAGVNPVYQSGDTNFDVKLDTSETWIYTATGTAAAGPYSNTGTASGSFTDSEGSIRTNTATDMSSYTGISAPPVPEFPSIALPAALIIGLIGAVLFIKSTREN